MKKTMTNYRSILLVLLSCTACAIAADQSVTATPTPPHHVSFNIPPQSTKVAPVVSKVLKRVTPLFNAFCVNSKEILSSLNTHTPEELRAFYTDANYSREDLGAQIMFKNGDKTVIIPALEYPILKSENSQGFVAQLSCILNPDGSSHYTYIAGSSDDQKEPPTSYSIFQAMIIKIRSGANKVVLFCYNDDGRSKEAGIVTEWLYKFNPTEFEVRKY